MITGDALLTAVHVAVDTAVIGQDRSKHLVLRSTNEEGKLAWECLTPPLSSSSSSSSSSAVFFPFLSTSMKTLVEQGYNLCLTGDSLKAAAEVSNEKVWRDMQYVRVFARMTPMLKEKVISSLKEDKRFTLMCGDGANDVGALKQAHVGLALLSGFGSANVKKEKGGEEGNDDAKGKKEGVDKKNKKGDKKGEHKLQSTREMQAELAKKRKEKQKAKLKETQDFFKLEYERRVAAGER